MTVAPEVRAARSDAETARIPTGAPLRTLACRSSEDLVVADTLYFGTNKPGGIVTPEEWQAFLATGVTPRFPQGITSWRASGQWRSETGALEHESSYVLQLVHADTAATERAVREVMDLYRAQFAQEALEVGRAQGLRALVAHAQEGATARIACEDFLYLEVFVIAEFEKTRHQRPPRTASIFFLSVSALNGFTM